MSNKIHTSSILADNLQLGCQCTIEQFCIIGCSGNSDDISALQTCIGDRAHIRSHVVIYAGNAIGSHFHAGHKVNIRECNQIGDFVSIGTLSVVEHHVLIEDGVRIHSQAFIPEYSILKKNAWIGPNVILTNAKYPNFPATKSQLQGPVIGRNARIGANSTILPGINIGENALIGAGSVVTKDIPDGMVAAGNPARVLYSVDQLPNQDGDG